MVKYLIYFLTLALVLNLSVQLESNFTSGTTVLLTNVLYRHGDRTPVHSYPTDPYGDVSLWPVGWGELTNTGKQQEYQLGQYLRSRYSGLLDTKFSPDDIYVLSTDVDRTLMSAQCNLAGLYPPMGDQVWNEDIQWQPIPVHSIPQKDDYLLFASKPCPAYDALLRALTNSSVVRDFDDAHSDTYKWITAHSGEVVTSTTSAALFYDDFLVQELYNLTLPLWATRIYPHPLREIRMFGSDLEAYSPKMQRLKSGPLLGQIATQIRQKAEGSLSPDTKMFMYSAHDDVIVNFLRTIGYSHPLLPKYAALLTLELQKDLETGELFVQVLYKDGLDADIETIPVFDCDVMCPLEQFLELTAPQIPEDWEQECNAVCPK